MKQYICTICGYIYDESQGDPESGIIPGTQWENIPDSWKCPICGASKSDFVEHNDVSDTSSTGNDDHLMKANDALPNKSMKELTPIELSVICSNLARGCEKQYMEQQADDFKSLSAYFKSECSPEENGVTDLLNLIEKDLQINFPLANNICKQNQDRGALRALTWSEKVTRMCNSLLKKYEQEGESMLKNTGVYVCTVCGFIYIGDNAPDLCPVCKVPNWKFEKIEGSDK